MGTDPSATCRSLAVQTGLSLGEAFLCRSVQTDQTPVASVCLRVMIRMAMRAPLFASLFFIVELSSGAAAQQKSPVIPLPEVSPCQERLHPRLSDKWRALFLMAPFTNAQLVLSDIVYDGSLPAMRIKLYGLRSGSLDLFITRSDTYVLSSQGGSVETCEKLGDTGWHPLPQDWLSSQSQCVGSAPLGKTDVQWWKTPIEPAPSSYWVWYKTSDQTPFRLAFQSPSDQLGVLSRFALSYQLRFERTSDAQFARVGRLCENAKRAAPDGARALEERIAALSSARERASEDIERLVPELAACPVTALPIWPDKLAITGLMTPWDANENPYSTEVFYNWTARAHRTRIFPHSHTSYVAQDALLLGPRGYNVTYRQKNGPKCTPVLPGALRPDWPSRGPCRCEAMLTGTGALTPYGAAQIFRCPLASPRAAWTWYALDGRPTSFAVTSLPGDEGFGLFAVLDYRDWLPGYEAPAYVFAEPAQCRAHGAARSETDKCSTCHLGKAGAGR